MNLKKMARWIAFFSPLRAIFVFIESIFGKSYDYARFDAA
jgi:hypothetical protein